jgi:3-hydroxyisobutyrate dehydrogenase
MNGSSGKIGFIGIGAMGTPMAANLVKAGHRLMIYDANSEHAGALAATHEVEVAQSLPELGQTCGTVITMLPDGKVVREVLCGQDDNFGDCVAATMDAGSLVIDMSSSSPLGTRELGPILEARGVRLIDAPVSNGVRGAIAGTLAIMVGGDRTIFEQCLPLFQSLGNQVFHAGPLGAGHAIKALNNYVNAAGLAATCEAVIAGQRFGLDPGVIVDILNASSGMNNTTKNKVKQFMLSGTFNAGFTTGLMAKDVRTALEIAQAMGGPTRLAEYCAAMWDDAERRFGPASDHTEMYRFLEKSA